MPARTGQEFLAGLRARPRNLRLGSDIVKDVTEHPALAGAAGSLARLFDLQHAHAGDCLMPDPDTGEAINVSHMIPRSLSDLSRRRRGLERIAAATAGMVGRDPGYCNIAIAGFAAERRLWSGPDGRNGRGADNLVEYQKLLRRGDLALTHALVQPTIVRRLENSPAGQLAPLHKVGETADSIVVSGSRALATLAPYADELAVWPGQPLRQEGCADYALAFVIPSDLPGLVYLCRDAMSSPGADPFDRPLTTRFDEHDAFVIFDQVEIPKDRVFIDGDQEIFNTVQTVGFAPNIQQHTTIRALTKLEFAYGVAVRMAEAVDDRSDATIDMLGELVCYIELTRAALDASEHNARDHGGVFFPDARPLHPLRATMAQWLPRALEVIQHIGRHNLLVTPSRAMLDDPHLRPMIDLHLATANDVGAEGRTALFRLAWDFVGSGLGGRQELYERFYLGSASNARRLLHLMSRGAPSSAAPAASSLSALSMRERADRLVDSMLVRGRHGAS